MAFWIEHEIAKRSFKQTRKGFLRWILLIAQVAVALSLAVMILTLAFVQGFQKEIAEKVFGFWGHITISHAAQDRSLESLPIDEMPNLQQELQNLESVWYNQDGGFNWFSEKQQPGYTASMGSVEAVYPYALLPGIITSKDQFEGLILKGLTQDYPDDFSRRYLKRGRLPAWDKEQPTRDIVLSEQTASRMRLDTGDRLIIYFVVDGRQVRRAFDLTGIYKTGLEEYDKKFALIDIRQIKQVLNWQDNQIGGYEIQISDLDDLDLFTEYIYFEKLPDDLYAESIRRKYPNIFEWLELQSINKNLILVLMAVVAIINMITALLILILERSRMIAVLKSIGATNWQIRKVFLIFAAYILGKGLLIGNVLGLGIALLQKATGFMSLDEANYYLSSVPVHINLIQWLGINAATFALTIFFLVLPSYLISRISPIKVLHFK